MFIYLIKSVYGPQLYRIFSQDSSTRGRYYIPGNLEYYSNSLLTLFRGLYVFCKWSSPLILAFAYRNSYLSLDGMFSLTKLACLFGVVVMSTLASRGLGRCRDPDYLEFIKQYTEVNRKKNFAEKQKFLQKYDFEMKNWYSDFVCSSKPPLFKNKTHRSVNEGFLSMIKYSIWRVLSMICVDTFGLRMMYPGVMIQNLIGNALLEGRAKLIEQKRAKRAIIQTCDGYRNKIDTLFVDQRSQKNSSSLHSLQNSNLASNGQYLVICCDGNASFYEVGCFQIPIESGYSALGWNYPGFGQSTGLPYPKQLTAAADAVMQYAFSLGFKQENIILFSWSIGGFAVSWLSNHYPDVKAVIMDACFDTITPLAQQQMPKFASKFVQYTIEHNLNLNVAELISKYHGPVMFIRRTQDEIISIIPRIAATNRGNDLLISTLMTRYPGIVDKDSIPYIRTWLSARNDLERTKIFSSYTSESIQICESILNGYASEQTGVKKYPITFGKENEADGLITKSSKLALAVYLADKYLLNFESSHCQPLSSEFFRIPWSENSMKQLHYSF
ncbi:abhydrolase domain-containing 16A [Brachionus plicatilis]|uniref:Abhydrolase domain-containing 16A n=1 Tax=Brachionus plicatilis TaxID=10195 RepID=A0A3M7PRL6_BRAPC|nr:abhydrolase domain-containing 16A [Brachionus plicatilis]